jgi:hypothetical protein
VSGESAVLICRKESDCSLMAFMEGCQDILWWALILQSIKLIYKGVSRQSIIPIYRPQSR